MDYCYAYIDDVLGRLVLLPLLLLYYYSTTTTSEEEHEQHLRFSEYGVLLILARCVFGATEVTFLCYKV